MKRVVFRTDGNTQTGLGHLMRCLALAQQLERFNVTVCFAVKSDSVPYCLSRHDWVGQIIVVPDCSSEQEVVWLKEQSAFIEADWLVVDGYQFDQEYRQALKHTKKRMALFDDNNNSGQLYADLVINGASDAEKLNYDATAPGAAYCLGERYRVLRQEFSLAEPIDFAQRQDLLISFGGSDPLNMTLPLLESLQPLGADMPIRVITGAAYQKNEAVQAFSLESTLNIQHLPNHQMMADAFSRARLVISAAGGSQFELMATGTPSMLVIVADNQRMASNTAAEQGWCEVIDLAITQNVQVIARRALTLWRDQAALEQMSQCAYQHSDTQGAERVVKRMLTLTECV